MQSEIISTPIYVECYKTYLSKVLFKNSSISSLTLIFLYAKNSLQVAKCDESYTVFFQQLMRTNGLVVKVNWRESGDLGSITDEC